MNGCRGKSKAATKKQLEEKIAIMEAKLAALVDGSLTATEPPLLAVADEAFIKIERKAPKANVEYTVEMVAMLLEIRYDHFGLAFQRAAAKAQRAVLWDKLTLKFNIIMEKKIASLSLKNKLNALRREYIKLKNERAATGN
ncbi:hypothetical protein AC1031_004555 [Aphanomyces cochlioides]|nr:hypothetical protein AC1031_004555 [Aphanomyces cochlioides]